LEEEQSCLRNSSPKFKGLGKLLEGRSSVTASEPGAIVRPHGRRPSLEDGSDFRAPVLQSGHTLGRSLGHSFEDDRPLAEEEDEEEEEGQR
jgi:hypothetical protein